MRLRALLDAIHESLELSTPQEIYKACDLIIRVQEMTPGERDVLIGAWKHGPLFDGDVTSKTSRDQLLRDGFMAKVVVKGQDGYNACTFLGHLAYRLLTLTTDVNGSLAVAARRSWEAEDLAIFKEWNPGFRGLYRDIPLAGRRSAAAERERREAQKGGNE